MFDSQGYSALIEQVADTKSASEAVKHSKTGLRLRFAWCTQTFASISREGWRYFLASAMAFAIDYGLLVFLTELGGLHYLISSCISYSIGAIIHYFISSRWVFDTHRLTDKRMEFTGFVCIGLWGLAVTQILLWFAVAMLGINYRTGKLIATGFSFILNFAARKLLLFTV